MLGIDLFNDDSIEQIKEAIICINDKLLSEYKEHVNKLANN